MIFSLEVTPITISEAFARYRDDYIVFKGQSRKTDEAYSVVQKSLESYFGALELDKLTFNDVRQWKLYLDRSRASGTVRGYVICLRVVLRYSRQHGEEALDPDLIPVPQRVVLPPKFLTNEEVTKIIQTAGTPQRGYCNANRIRNQAIIALLYSSGIRVSELCSLDRDSIYKNSFSVTGKGGKTRPCFVDERAAQLIKDYLRIRKDTDKALFVCHQTGKRITPNSVQRMFVCVGEKSKLGKRLNPHLLRHSFATNLLINNCNLRYVQALLGHSSLATTQIYTHIIDKDLQGIHARFHTT